MKQVFLDFLSDTLDQVFGIKPPKTGKLGITYWGVKRKEEYGLTFKDLEDVFRYGEQVKEKMMVRKYTNYSVGLIFYKPIDEDRFVIITCWKN